MIELWLKFLRIFFWNDRNIQTIRDFGLWSSVVEDLNFKSNHFTWNMIRHRLFMAESILIPIDIFSIQNLVILNNLYRSLKSMVHTKSYLNREVHKNIKHVFQKQQQIWIAAILSSIAAVVVLIAACCWSKLSPLYRKNFLRFFCCCFRKILFEIVFVTIQTSYGWLWSPYNMDHKSVHRGD